MPNPEIQIDLSAEDYAQLLKDADFHSNRHLLRSLWLDALNDFPLDKFIKVCELTNLNHNAGELEGRFLTALKEYLAYGPHERILQIISKLTEAEMPELSTTVLRLSGDSRLRDYQRKPEIDAEMEDNARMQWFRQYKGKASEDVRRQMNEVFYTEQFIDSDEQERSRNLRERQRRLRSGTKLGALLSRMTPMQIGALAGIGGREYGIDDHEIAKLSDEEGYELVRKFSLPLTKPEEKEALGAEIIKLVLRKRESGEN